jgi:hypothetical protein
MFRSGARVLAAATVVASVCASLPPSASASTPLTRGFADDVWFGGGTPWVTRTIATGAKVVLIEADWSGLEPQRPAGGLTSDPGSPAFNFAQTDTIARTFAGTGISVAFLVTDAPRWAESDGGPKGLEAAGAWKPDAKAFGRLASALARRYSGTYPDPQNPGQALPRVRYFQAWAEPNLSVHLAPQWKKRGRTFVPAGPALYRGLLNAFYAGVKAVHRSNVVVTAGFAPYGDQPGGPRMPPATFVRELTCLRGERLAKERCPNPARFDVLAMDPYEVGPPTQKAFNRDDVSAPDLGKLTRILRRAVQLRTVRPAVRKQLWVTEFSYDSNPPNPTAISTATQARWLEESFYEFWTEGASAVVWYLVRDQVGPFATAYFSGVYFRDGEPKPSFEAYRFPFVVMPGRGGRETVWGIAPRTGLLSVQLAHGHGWRTLFRVHARAGGVFVKHISGRVVGDFRASVAGETSLVWSR